MNLQRYEYFSSDYKAYQFYSEGPKGRIKKVVTFFKIQNDPIVYNLAFGDEDSQTGVVSDTIVTNNNDKKYGACHSSQYYK
ncbi:DUF6934 family protein [Mucilaginibacter celer]|uniref:DUF6934 family protein n=1 Tax=Mucilaginibacter celer TaxID=2305508 RepID=UPI0026B23EB7